MDYRSKVVRSKLTFQYPLRPFTEAGRGIRRLPGHSIALHRTPSHSTIFTRCGAAVARVIHNHEGTRSKRVAGILFAGARALKKLNT